MNVRDWILMTLAARGTVYGRDNIKEMCDTCGCRPAALRVHLDKLRRSGEIVATARGYRLP